MELFESAQNILIHDSTFNDNYGNVHSFNRSVCMSNVNSYNISCAVGPRHVDSPQPIIKETEGVPHGPGTEEDSKTEEIDDGGGVVSEDGHPIDGTFQFHDCQYVAVYIHSGNASDIKVEDCGHTVSQVIHHGGTVIVPSNSELPTYINEGAPSSPKPKATLGQSYRYQGVPPNFTFGSPSIISPPSCHTRQDSSSCIFRAQSGSPGIPPVRIQKESRQNNPFLKQFMIVPPGDTPPTFEEGQVPVSRDKLPATIETTLMQANHATSGQHTPKLPAPTTLPGPAFQPFSINPFLPTHTGLSPNFLSHILQPFPGNVQSIPPNNGTADNWDNPCSQTIPRPFHYPAESSLATNSSQDIPDTDSKRLEYHLHSALEIVMHTSGISSLAEILTPRAHNILKALNALVSEETPVTILPRTIASDPPTRSSSFRKVTTRWLRTARPPK